MSRTETDFRPKLQTRFGIVIPVRLMPSELPGAIDSVLHQQIGGRQVNTAGVRDVDIVVVVDDLDPETRVVLDGYGDRVRWVEGDKRGQAGAVNKGLGLIGGEIVKWLNADDRMWPGALATMDRAFYENPKADFIYGDIVFLDSAGTVVAEHLEPRYSPFILLFGQNLFADPACFWRRSLHDRVGPISEDTKYSLDYDFWVRIVRHRIKVVQVLARIAAFKVTGNNMSVVHSRAMRIEHYDIVALHYPGWRVVPRPLRLALLWGLLLLARVYKRVQVRRQRGKNEGGAFKRLMSKSLLESRN
jgi:glycosyltransferase involved in cell wall biosynthesis